MEEIERRWRDVSCRPFYRSPTITDKGVLLGFETRLVRRFEGDFDLANDARRALCLLAIVGKRPPHAHSIEIIKRAIDLWERGDPCLAHLHLAFANSARVGDMDDAWRLFLADVLIESGMTPLVLAKELGFDPRQIGLSKYDPDQPRNSAGSGASGGRWTKEPAAALVSPPKPLDARAPSPLVSSAPSLADALGAEAVAWLTRLAGRLAVPLALFGAAFIPSPNAGVASEGDVPGRPGLRYRLDNDAGTLRLSRQDDPDSTHALVAQLSVGGIYREVGTGVPIARAIGGNVAIIDLDRTPGAADDTRSDEENPKLCPDPERDKQGGRMLFDEMYQQYVRDTVNPERRPQLPPDLSFALPGGGPSGWTFYDDCREADGTMIEAKGNYGRFASTAFGQGHLREDWEDQADRQIRAANGRHIEWYFHSASAAAVAAELFAEKKYDKSISIHVLPYPGGVPKYNPRIR